MRQMLFNLCGSRNTFYTEIALVYVIAVRSFFSRSVDDDGFIFILFQVR